MFETLRYYSVELLSIMTGVLIMISIWLSKKMLKVFINQLNEMNKKLYLVIIEQQSTDYALEKNFGNGYSKHKSEKKEELIKNYQFRKGDENEIIF